MHRYFLALGIILVGLLLFVVMSKQIYEDFAPFAWQKARCVIEKSEVLFSTGADSQCKHRLEYRYEAAGEQRVGHTWRLDPGVPYEWCSAWASFASNFAQNTTVDCYVDPLDPKRSVLDRGNIFAILKLLFPIGLMSIGVLLFRRRAVPSHDTTKARIRFAAQGIALCVFLTGAVGTFFAGVIPLYELYSARDWVNADCTVLSSALKSSSASTTGGQSGGSRGYHMEIIYSYTVGQQTYVTDRFDFIKMGSGDANKLSQTTDKYPLGATVQCWIDAQNPFEAVLDRSFSAKYISGFLPLIAMFGGLLFLAGARKLM